MGLEWKPISKEEKLKIMDKMLRYIRKNATAVYDKDNPRDLYQTCKVVAGTDLFEFLQDYCEEVE